MVATALFGHPSADVLRHFDEDLLLFSQFRLLHGFEMIFEEDYVGCLLLLGPFSLTGQLDHQGTSLYGLPWRKRRLLVFLLFNGIPTAEVALVLEDEEMTHTRTLIIINDFTHNPKFIHTCPASYLFGVPPAWPCDCSILLVLRIPSKKIKNRSNDKDISESRAKEVQSRTKVVVCSLWREGDAKCE